MDETADMRLAHAAGAGYSSSVRGVITRHPPVTRVTLVAVLEGEGLLEHATTVGPGDIIELLPGESFVIEAVSAVLRCVEVPIPD